MTHISLTAEAQRMEFVIDSISSVRFSGFKEETLRLNAFAVH